MVKRVLLESPYKGTGASADENYKNSEANDFYLGRCIRDMAFREESPYASHAVLPLGLDDEDEFERALGIRLGFSFRDLDATDYSVFYGDGGLSTGMGYGIADCLERNRPFKFRFFLDGLDKKAVEATHCAFESGEWTMIIKGKSFVGKELKDVVDTVRLFHA